MYLSGTLKTSVKKNWQYIGGCEMQTIIGRFQLMEMETGELHIVAKNITTFLNLIDKYKSCFSLCGKEIKIIN